MSPRRMANALLGFGVLLVSAGFTEMTTENSPFWDWVGPVLMGVGLFIIVVSIQWHALLTWLRTRERDYFAGVDLPKKSLWRRFFDWALPRNEFKLFGEEDAKRYDDDDEQRRW